MPKKLWDAGIYATRLKGKRLFLRWLGQVLDNLKAMRALDEKALRDRFVWTLVVQNLPQAIAFIGDGNAEP